MNYQEKAKIVHAILSIRGMDATDGLVKESMLKDTFFYSEAYGYVAYISKHSQLYLICEGLDDKYIINHVIIGEGEDEVHDYAQISTNTCGYWAFGASSADEFERHFRTSFGCDEVLEDIAAEVEEYEASYIPYITADFDDGSCLDTNMLARLGEAIGAINTIKSYAEMENMFLGKVSTEFKNKVMGVLNYIEAL